MGTDLVAAALRHRRREWPILPIVAERPRRTAHQQLGQLAEQVFGTFVLRQNAIWHPTTLGNDIGIDGRVELTEESDATAVEFGVQIKGAKRLAKSRRGHILAGRAKSSTALYWLARLSPTLVVAYDNSGDKLYAEWAHRLPGIAELPRIAKPPARVSLKLPARELTDETWVTLTQQATAIHKVIIDAFESDQLRSVLSLLYVRLAGIHDVLIEWVYTLAYPPNRSIDFEGQTIALPGLRPARFQSEGGFMFPIHLAVGAVALSDGFYETLRSHLDPSHPVYKAVGNFSDALHEIVDAMFVDDPLPLQGGEPGVSLHWRQVDSRVVITNLGLTALQIREFNRELRSFLFPVQLSFAGFDHLQRGAQFFKMIRDLSEGLFTPIAELRRSE